MNERKEKKKRKEGKMKGKWEKGETIGRDEDKDY